MSTVAEYKALKERGEQLFDGLRDLPQFGKRLWEPYFRRTFDVYNQLWKFQQEHRGTLEAEYGLQRHEVRLRANAAARCRIVVTAVRARVADRRNSQPHRTALLPVLPAQGRHLLLGRGARLLRGD